MDTSYSPMTGYAEITKQLYMSCVKDRKVGPGTYDIDERMYRMKIVPPLQIEASGPNGEYQKTDYAKTGTGCSTPVYLVLEKEKTYTKLVVTSLA